MKRPRFNQTGFSHHLLLPVLAVLGVAAIGSYIVSHGHAATLTTYSRVSVKSVRTQCMDNKNGRGIAYNPVQIYKCVGNNNQKWAVHGTATTAGEIISFNVSYCLNVYHAGKVVGTPVDVYPCKNSAAEQWTVNKTTGEIRNPNSKLCLGYGTPINRTGTSLKLVTCSTTSATDLWTVTTLSGGRGNGGAGNSGPTTTGRFGIALGGGWQGYNSSQLNTYFSDMESMGAQWVRFDLNWMQIQPSSSPSYNWSAFDNVANAARAHNLKVLAILDEAPTWAQESSCAGNPWCPPNGPNNYAAFAGAAAKHYAPLGVTTFEIWNEENQTGFWIGPNAASYTALLKSAYTAIHNAEPNDFVVSGGVSPGLAPIIQPNDFVQQMYADGAKGYFDALGIHPYCFSDTSVCATNNSSNTDVWGQMAYGPNNIVSIMRAHGDGNKKIWMTEFGDNNPSGASQEMKDAFTLTNGQPWAGPIFWYDYTGDGSFGLVGTPAYTTYKQLTGK